MDASRRPALESLESRVLFSSVNLFNGLLVVRPDFARSNTITVQNTEDQTEVAVTINSMNSAGIVKTLTKSFPRTDVISSIHIVGTSKADTITAGTDEGKLGVPLFIEGKGGDDVITVGDDQATIFTASGNSTIRAGDGNDVIHLGGGKNTVTVGNGNDKIRLGSGKDTVTAGDGQDIIRGGAAADSITVGNGDDSIFGGGGNDVITAGDGNSSIYGGSGNDLIKAGNGNNTIGVVHGRNTIFAGSGHDTYIARSAAYFKLQTTNFDPGKDTLVFQTRLPAAPVI